MDETASAPEILPPPRFIAGVAEDHPVAKLLAGVKVEGFEAIDPLAYDFEHCWTRTHHDQPYLKDDVIAAIICSGSNYATMSLLLGRNRQRIKDYVLANMDVYEAFVGVEQTFLDIIEHTGKVQAALGDSSQIRFFLMTQGKDRGYTTRVEQTDPNRRSLHPDMGNYSEEELERLAEIHHSAQSRTSSNT